ncbi:uncharacterized protein NPIL_594101 [Nephila pilipes]|uniref:Uncharacterized protein n=1 Tax=Nephila pilipes TaxID=299642 RepID=A0A8X6TZA3_NEPPI|nr:uncharacterized protein NPIL_594101 [Nephila pilipes]
MKSFAGNSISDEVIKSLWLQRLPQQTQAILSISNDTLDKIAEMADKILQFVRNMPNIACRREINKRKKLSEYLQVLNQLSKDCDFTDVKAKEYRKEYIRDAFIRGLKCPRFRQRLLENTSMTLDQDFEQVRSLESAEVHASSYMGSSFPVQSAAMKTDDFSEETLATSVASSSSTSQKCFFWGNDFHSRTICPDRDVICRKCGEKEQWFSPGVRYGPATGFITDRFKNFRARNLSIVEKQDLQQWLKESTSPLEKVVQLMKETFEGRRFEILKNSTNITSNWPRILSPHVVRICCALALLLPQGVFKRNGAKKLKIRPTSSQSLDHFIQFIPVRSILLLEFPY